MKQNFLHAGISSFSLNYWKSYVVKRATNADVSVWEWNVQQAWCIYMYFRGNQINASTFSAKPDCCFNGNKNFRLGVEFASTRNQRRKQKKKEMSREQNVFLLLLFGAVYLSLFYPVPERKYSNVTERLLQSKHAHCQENKRIVLINNKKVS